MVSPIKEIALRIANERDSELDACEILEMYAKKCELLSDSIDEMRLAFIEAFINAKEHAPKNIEQGLQNDILVKFKYENDLLTIFVRDFGCGFDPNLVEKPDIKKKLKSTNKRGWGLMLMEKLMDSVEIESFPPSGTLIKLIKKRIKIEPPNSEEIIKEKKKIERLKYILSSFIDLSSFLCQNRDLESGLRSMLRILLGTLGFSKGGIYIFNSKTNEMEALVDIKSKIKEKLPQFQINSTDVTKLSAIEELDITSKITEFFPQFYDKFSKEEIENIYLLKVDSQLMGLLVLGSKFKKEDYEISDSELLSTLARNISSAINTFKLLEQLKITNFELDTRVKELNYIREATQTISAQLEIETLPYTIEKIFKNVLNIEKFSIAVYDKSEDKFFICQTGRNLPTVLDLWNSEISRYVIHKQVPIFCPDITQETRFQFPRMANYNTTSFVVVPVIVQDELLAVINLTDKKDCQPITERDYNMALLLSSQIGIALKNAQLYKLGITDIQTNLYNSHYFKLRLSQEIARVRRTKSPLSAVYIKLNSYEDLKNYSENIINSAFSKISNVIKQNIRLNDIPCRAAIDEFSIILPDTSIDGAFTVANKLYNQITKLQVMEKGQIINISVTIAISQYRLDMNLDQFLDNLLENLQKAINSGGNMIYGYNSK